MPITTIGFDGTIDDSALSRLLAVAVGPNTVLNRASMAVTAVANARSVRVAPGTAYAPGLAVTNTDAPIIALPAPSAGQWHMIVLRRNWDTNEVTFLALPHVTTTTALPETPPAGLPADFKNNPGILVDQKLAWAWVVTGQTAVQVIDLRDLPPGLPRRGTTAERTTYYGASPTFTAARRQLQGSRWFNTDTSLEEVYMGAYDAVDNPGGVQAPGGKDLPGTPGWYSVGNNGDVNVFSTRYPDSLLMGRGARSVWDRLDFTLAQGRFLHFRTAMRWVARANCAGTIYVTFNGVSIEGIGAEMRLHSEGGMQGSTWNVIEYDLWVPPGTHRIDSLFSSESGGSDSYKQDAYTIVSGAAW